MKLARSIITFFIYLQQNLQKCNFGSKVLQQFFFRKIDNFDVQQSEQSIFFFLAVDINFYFTPYLRYYVLFVKMVVFIDLIYYL